MQQVIKKCENLNETYLFVPISYVGMNPQRGYKPSSEVFFDYTGKAIFIKYQIPNNHQVADWILYNLRINRRANEMNARGGKTAKENVVGAGDGDIFEVTWESFLVEGGLEGIIMFYHGLL